MRHPSRRGLSDGEVPEAITAAHLNRRSCRYVREEYMQRKACPMLTQPTADVSSALAALKPRDGRVGRAFGAAFCLEPHMTK